MAGTSASLFKALNGVFCIFKPAGKSMKNAIPLIQNKLAEALNQLDVREPRVRLQYVESADNPDDLPVISTAMDYSDHPLVSGPRYLPEYFRIGCVDALSTYASGIVVMGIGAGCRMLPVIKNAKLLRVYHIKGELGRATTTFTTKGNLLERSTHYHLTVEKLNRVVSSFQAAHQRHMFEAAGVFPESQEAYELASQGLVRPTVDQAGPVLYNIKLIDYKQPEFTLEIHCSNESNKYLVEMVHKIGLQSRTNAVCMQLRRIRYGMLNLEHTLLKKHWDPHGIVTNIADCRQIIQSFDLKHRPCIEDGRNVLPRLQTDVS